LRIEIHARLERIGINLIDRDIGNDGTAIFVRTASRIAQQRGEATP
jgi:hypothetical protein